MNPPNNRSLGIWFIAFCIVALPIPANASTLVIDSFDVGGMSLMLPGDRVEGANVGGRVRLAVIQRLAPEVTVSANQLAGGSTLQFSVDATGASGSIDNYLRLDFQAQDPRVENLLGYDAFELEFSQLSGIGELIVRINDDSPILGSPYLRSPLAESGVLTIPFSIVAGSSAAGQTHQFDFTFLNSSPEFSFTLDEIRLVPEPGVAALGAVFVFWLSTTRRRRSII